MRTLDPEAVEREAARVFASFQSTRGARLVTADPLFAQAVMKRVRELAAGCLEMAWTDPH